MESGRRVALGAQCIGVERVAEYYALSQRAIPQLAALAVASNFGLVEDAAS